MKFFLLLILFSAATLSCKKKGCTDILAKNFNQEADKDDNTCTFDASVIFWIDAAASIGFQNSAANNLSIFVDEVKVGQMSTMSNQITTPDCNTAGVTHFIELGAETSTTISYKITYESFNGPNTTTTITHAEGNLTLEGGKCTPYLIQ